MATSWKSPANVFELVDALKSQHHHPRLEQAQIAVCFMDNKPFSPNGRINWGKVTKFSQFNRIWQAHKYDFSMVICADLWHSILSKHQREALVDLQLSRMEVEYEPEMNEEGKPVKDEWGRGQFTNDVKLDDEGSPKWRVLPLDLDVFAKNVRRYGLWCEEIHDFSHVVAMPV